MVSTLVPDDHEHTGDNESGGSHSQHYYFHTTCALWHPGCSTFAWFVDMLLPLFALLCLTLYYMPYTMYPVYLDDDEDSRYRGWRRRSTGLARTHSALTAVQGTPAITPVGRDSVPHPQQHKHEHETMLTLPGVAHDAHPPLHPTPPSAQEDANTLVDTWGLWRMGGLEKFSWV